MNLKNVKYSGVVLAKNQVMGETTSDPPDGFHFHTGTLLNFLIYKC